MSKIQAVNETYCSSWLDKLDGRTELAKDLRQKYRNLTSTCGDLRYLTHQHNSFITSILWLKYWLEQKEASLASDVEFKAGKWIQGTKALFGLYSQLEKITKYTQKARPITINVVKSDKVTRDSNQLK